MDESPILATVESPEPYSAEQEEPFFEPEEEEVFLRPSGGFWAIGGRLTWVAALVLTVSAFTDWYAGAGSPGPTISVVGGHTGALGKRLVLVGLGLPALADAGGAG